MTDNSTRVIGGVDTHRDTHVAAALDERGGQLGVESFPATATGHQELHDWLAGFGPIDRVGVEGTGCYRAGLSRHLQTCGVEVIEVDRPNRQLRRRAGKSDPVDAVSAARAAQSGEATSVAKTANGDVEKLRVLRITRTSARNEKIRVLNQLRSLVVTAPDHLRAELTALTAIMLPQRCARWLAVLWNYEPRSNSSTASSRRSWLEPHRSCWPAAVLAPTEQQRCWSLRETTRGGSTPRLRSPSCAAPRPWKHRQGKPSGTGSHGPGTVKPTLRSIRSCWCAWSTMNPPAATSPADERKAAPASRS